MSESSEVSPAEAMSLIGVYRGVAVSGADVLKLTLIEMIRLGILRFQTREPKRYPGRLWSDEHTVLQDAIVLVPAKKREPLPNGKRFSEIAEAIADIDVPGRPVSMMDFACFLRERYDVDFPKFIQECVYPDLCDSQLLEIQTTTRFFVLKSTHLMLTSVGDEICRRWVKRQEALDLLEQALAAQDSETIAARALEVGLALVLEESLTPSYTCIASCLREAGMAENDPLVEWLEILSQIGSALKLGLTTFTTGLNSLQGSSPHRDRHW